MPQNLMPPCVTLNGCLKTNHSMPKCKKKTTSPCIQGSASMSTTKCSLLRCPLMHQRNVLPFLGVFSKVLEVHQKSFGTSVSWTCALSENPWPQKGCEIQRGNRTRTTMIATKSRCFHAVSLWHTLTMEICTDKCNLQENHRNMILSTQWSRVRTSMSSCHHNSLENKTAIWNFCVPDQRKHRRIEKTTSQINSPVVVFGSCSYLRSPKALFLCSTLCRKKLKNTSNHRLNGGLLKALGHRAPICLDPSIDRERKEMMPCFRREVEKQPEIREILPPRSFVTYST